MPVLCYLDGSGQHDTSKTWTLACIVAPRPTWEVLNVQWAELMSRYGLRNFHATDWASLGRAFSRRKGWDETKGRQLHVDITCLIAKFRQDRLHAYTCSILMEDYERAKRDDPELKSPQSICVDFCIGGLQLTAEELAEPRPVHVFFDRGEPYMHPIYQAWCRGKRLNTWREQIRTIEQADSSCPGIQIADLYAWGSNRHLSNGDWSFVAASLLLALPRISNVYDYSGLRAVYDGRRIRPGPHKNRPLSVDMQAAAWE